MGFWYRLNGWLMTEELTFFGTAISGSNEVEANSLDVSHCTPSLWGRALPLLIGESGEGAV